MKTPEQFTSELHMDCPCVRGLKRVDCHHCLLTSTREWAREIYEDAAREADKAFLDYRSVEFAVLDRADEVLGEKEHETVMGGKIGPPNRAQSRRKS